MTKHFSIIVIAAVTTIALAGAASAGPGNGNNNGQIGGLGGAQINLGGFGGAKGGGGYSGGEIDSPGDAFYPTGAPQSREDSCHSAGGQVVIQIEGGRSVFTCIL